MKALANVRGFRALVIAMIMALTAAAPANARGGGHGGGGHAGGFGSHGGGFSRFHAGYGYRGGFGGRYGAWYGDYGYGGWAWPGYGLFPVPYYADDNYYMWDNSIGEFEGVNPPAEILEQASMQPTPTELFAYPKNAQSAELQAQDKQQCQSWAQSQTTPGSAQRQDYLRAQAACLQGRGYSVR
jgi:hypothetical protein